MNNEHTQTLSVGDRIPNLQLKTFYKNKETDIDISDYKGKWKIFFFYPADFTFVCPTELEEMADHYDDFQKEDVEIFSISTDSVFTHKAWHDESPAIGKIKFPMVADRNGKLATLFNVYIEEVGESLRGTFIIDPDGIIKTVEINDNDIGRSAKECMRKLLAIKYVSKHAGKVCPASWQPGDDTLEPGMDLVGKI